jgi:putative lipoprotein
VSAVEARLRGTVLYRERMALPADAIIEIRLEDVSLADAPADVLAEQTIVANGRQVPIPFEVTYSPARVEPNRRYAWRAAIRTAGGELMFATTTHQAALEAGAPTENIAILVQRTGGGTGQSAGAVVDGPGSHRDRAPAPAE